MNLVKEFNKTVDKPMFGTITQYTIQGLVSYCKYYNRLTPKYRWKSVYVWRVVMLGVFINTSTSRDVYFNPDEMYSLCH